ncbi:MAG: GAF domain-containing protein [Cyanobacteria bacterium P01_F01_bin.33]
MTAILDPSQLGETPSRQLLSQLQAANAIMQDLGVQRDPKTGKMRVQDDPRAIARAVTRAVVEQLHMANARVWFHDPSDRSLRLVAQAGISTPADERVQHLLPDDSPLGQVVQRRQPLLSNTLAREPWILYPEWIERSGLVGMASYPILLGDETIGSLATFSYEPLAPEFLEVLKLICTHTASAIANARQNCQLRRQSEQQVLLNRITDHIRHTLNLDEILQSAVTELGKAMNASRVQFLFGSARDEVVTYRHAYAAPGVDNWAGRQIQVRGNSLARELFNQDEAIAVREWSTFEDLEPTIAQALTAAGVASMMLASIRLGKGSYGVLSVHQCRQDYCPQANETEPANAVDCAPAPNDELRVWTSDERELVESVTEQLAIAINQSHLYERTQQQARREGLLNEVSSDIRNSLDPNQVLDSIVQALAATLELEGCNIDLYDLDTEFPQTFDLEKYDTQHPSDATVLSIYDTLSNGYPAVITAADWPHISETERDFFHLDHPATTALMPLLQEGDLLGTITLVAAASSDRFQPDELTLAIAVAEHAGIALKQAQLYDRTRRLAQRENLLRQMAQHLTGTYELTDIVRIALAGMADVLQVDRCAYVTLTSQSLSIGPDPANAETIQQFILDQKNNASSDKPADAAPTHFYIAQEYRRSENVPTCLNCKVSDDLSWLLLLNCYGKRTSLLIEDLQTAQLSPESRQRMAEENLRSLLAVPLVVDRDIVGVLCTSLSGYERTSVRETSPGQTSRPRGRSFASDELDLVQALADMSAVAVQRAQFSERARLQDATAAAMRGLSEGREAESRRLAADLHDQTLADLGALSRQMQHLAQDEHLELATTRDTLNRMDGQLRTTIAELRRIVEDLKPTAMLAFNFSSALRSLLDRAIERSLTPLIARFDDRSAGRINQLETFSQTTLFRIVQEALNNIVKHAHAKRVDCIISVSSPAAEIGSTVGLPATLELKIIDDGKGIPDNPQRVGSHGLLNMRYRAELIGGAIEWRSRRSGTGTIVAISIPLSNTAVSE